MKNIDMEKIKRLVDIFTDLDEDYQDKAISYLYKLLIFEQSARKNAIRNLSQENRKNIREEDVEEEKRRINKRLINMTNIILDLDNENKAKMVIAMESFKKGAFTKNDEISVVINTKETSLEEFIAKEFTGIDYSQTKKETEGVLKKLDE